MNIYVLNFTEEIHIGLYSPISSPIKSPVSSSMVTSINTNTPPALPPKRSKSTSSKSSPPPTPHMITEIEQKSPAKSLPDLLEHTTASMILPISSKEVSEAAESSELCDIDLMEETEIGKYLVYKNPDEEGPDIKGGCTDALIIQATKATKNGGK